MRSLAGVFPSVVLQCDFSVISFAANIANKTPFSVRIVGFPMVDKVGCSGKTLATHLADAVSPLCVFLLLVPTETEETGEHFLTKLALQQSHHVGVFSFVPGQLGVSLELLSADFTLDL